MSQDERTQALPLTAISVTGTDAAAFVQSQLTLDLDSLPVECWRPAAWCRPDGRVAAVMLVARDEQRCWLIVPKAIAESLVARLRMFSIGRQVELGADHAAFVDDDGGDGLPLDYDRDRRLGIETGGRPVALPAQWLRRDIACGMPGLVEATQGRFLPQMLGLEPLGGLSYAKGCYPGQEVIARVHYRGRVTRRSARFVLDQADPPQPGAEGEVAGEPATVLYAVDRAGDGGVEGLAVVPAEAPATAPLRVGQGIGELVPD